MRRLSPLIAGLAGLAVMTVQPLCAEEAMTGPVYVVRYFDAAPAAAHKVAELAGKFLDEGRKSQGNTAFDILEEIGRPDRFAIYEAWRDRKALEAHDAASPTTAFRDEMQPMMISPISERTFSGLAVAPPAGSGGRGEVYVLTHVDVFPNYKDQAVELVKVLAEAGRKDSGNLWFDVLQWDGHPNHFTLVAAWRDRKAFDASVMAAHTKDFRQKLTPLEGALYDERLYQVVR